ncbi:hypothetical protein EVAR_54015_1 [Eumeta japonica]|uniref:Uncharacterized protein n=1 Tax=Eumeta variegata TaxID=151549 RepID=A0A4C1XRL8_EUMVA|nr:hypothetical protein EVAR_54015_1 [Eumeta japonica]
MTRQQRRGEGRRVNQGAAGLIRPQADASRLQFVLSSISAPLHRYILDCNGLQTPCFTRYTCDCDQVEVINDQTTWFLEAIAAGEEKFSNGHHELDVAVLDDLSSGGLTTWSYRDSYRPAMKTKKWTMETHDIPHDRQ